FSVTQLANAAELNLISGSEASAPVTSSPSDKKINSQETTAKPLESTAFLEDTLSLKPSQEPAGSFNQDYEYNRSRFQDALEQLRPEYATAVILQSIKSEDLKQL